MNEKLIYRNVLLVAKENKQNITWIFSDEKPKPIFLKVH